jgi:hypothetical protein
VTAIEQYSTLNNGSTYTGGVIDGVIAAIQGLMNPLSLEANVVREALAGSNINYPKDNYKPFNGVVSIIHIGTHIFDAETNRLWNAQEWAFIKQYETYIGHQLSAPGKTKLIELCTTEGLIS